VSEVKRRKPMTLPKLAKGKAMQLADITRRYTEHRAEQSRRARDLPPEPLIVRSAADITLPLPPRWVSAIETAQDDPVRFSLRASAREIGWWAFACGGLDLMHRVSDLAEEAGGEGWVIDKWWDNIGAWEHGGVWCS
jgi:hypothetical protein